MNSSSLIFLFILSLVIALVFMPAQGSTRRNSKAAKLKSHLKQIATTVEMYHRHTITDLYPSNPQEIDIDQSLISEVSANNWHDLSLKSPYYFFPYSGKKFTYNTNVPLATNWEAVIENGHEYYSVVWEDGHVSYISPEEHTKLFMTDLKALFTLTIYKVTLRNNQALQ